MISRFPVQAIAFMIAMAWTVGWSTGQSLDVGVVPPRISIVISPGTTVTESVQVTSKSASEFTVEQGDFTIDESGKIAFLGAGAGPYSATGWIVPESTAFELKANEVRSFRFTVTAPTSGVSGTYTSMLYFSSAAGASNSANVGVNTVARIGVAIYVTIAGTETTGSTLNDFYRADDGSLVLSVENTGNTLMRVGGRIEIRDGTGATVATLPIKDAPILRGSQRDLRVPLPADLGKGFFDAVAFVSDSRGGMRVGELPFEEK